MLDPGTVPEFIINNNANSQTTQETLTEGGSRVVTAGSKGKEATDMGYMKTVNIHFLVNENRLTMPECIKRMDFMVFDGEIHLANQKKSDSDEKNALIVFFWKPRLMA